MIVKNDALLETFRCKTRCEYCRSYTPAGAHPHHWRARGAGGGHRLDVAWNLISLDLDCHDKVHRGLISRDKLLIVIARREGVTPEVIVAELNRLAGETNLALPTPERDIRLNGTGNRHRPSPGEADSNNLISSMPVHRSGSERSLLSTLETGDTSMHGHLRLNGVEEMEVKIVLDADFQKYMPASSDDEISRLRGNLKANGCRDALVVWKETGILLDGYTRYDICTELGIKYQIIEISLPDRAAALVWIVNNQLGRRNLTPESRTYLIGVVYNAAKEEKGGDRKSEEKSNGQNDSLILGGKNSEEIAKKHNVSPKTVERAGKFAEYVDEVSEDAPEVKPAMLTGEISRAETEFLASLSKDKRFALLAKEKAKPGSIKAAMDKKKKPPKPKPDKAKPFADDDKDEEPPDETVEGQIKAKNHEIESFCRRLKKFAEDNFPKDEWIDDMGRGTGTLQKFKDGCATIRSAKCHSACPLCKGEGCSRCHKTGRVPKYNYDQMVK